MKQLLDLNGDDCNFPYALHSVSQFINHKAKHCQKLQCGFKSHVSATASFMLQHREWVIRTTSNFFFQEEKINLILLPTMLFIRSSFNRRFLPTITARSANAIQVIYTDCDLCHPVYAYNLWQTNNTKAFIHKCWQLPFRLSPWTVTFCHSVNVDICGG